jgi:hypothetical protein
VRHESVGIKTNLNYDLFIKYKNKEKTKKEFKESCVRSHSEADERQSKESNERKDNNCEHEIKQREKKK